MGDGRPGPDIEEQGHVAGRTALKHRPFRVLVRTVVNTDLDGKWLD